MVFINFVYSYFFQVIIECPGSMFCKCIDNESVIHPKWKHIAHSTIWSEELIDNAYELISINPLLTLDEIIAEMVYKYNAPNIQKTTLNSY